MHHIQNKQLLLVRQFQEVTEGIPPQVLICDPIIGAHCSSAAKRTGPSPVVVSDFCASDENTLMVKNNHQLLFFYMTVLVLLLRKHGAAAVVQQSPKPPDFDWRSYKKTRLVARRTSWDLCVRPDVLPDSLAHPYVCPAGWQLSLATNRFKRDHKVVALMPRPSFGLMVEVRSVTAPRRDRLYTRFTNAWDIPSEHMVEPVPESLVRSKLNEEV